MVPLPGPGPLWRGRVLGLSHWRLFDQGLALALLALWPLPPLAAHLPLLALALALAAPLGLALAAPLALPVALARSLGAPLGDLAHLALGSALLVALVVLALVVGLGLVGPLVVLAPLVVVG